MIKIICKEIVLILENVGENDWKNAFQNIVDASDSTELSILKKEIKKMYGGMGSFNDLVLYKDGQPCIKENQQIDELRKKLFIEITS